MSGLLPIVEGWRCRSISWLLLIFMVVVVVVVVVVDVDVDDVGRWSCIFFGSWMEVMDISDGNHELSIAGGAQGRVPATTSYPWIHYDWI